RRIQDLVALLVADAALVVGYVVVLEQLLADVEVARFYLALCRFDAARDDARLDGLTIGHLEPVHDGLDAVAREDAHQRIVQAQVKARRTGVALAARTATQLVVDAARLVPLRGDDAQPAQILDLVVALLPLSAQACDARFLGACIERFVRLDGGDV